MASVTISKIYTHVGNKEIGKIKSPLDNLNIKLEKGVK